MKRSHLSTPRTLSECHWESGYPLAPSTRSSDRWADLVIALLAVAVCAAIVLGVM